MVFAKSLRNLVLGLIAVGAASAGYVNPASADVVFEISSQDVMHPMGSFNSYSTPLEWYSDSIGRIVQVNLSGSDYAALQGFTRGFFQFNAPTTGPVTAGPTVTLTNTFELRSENDGGGILLLAGTGTSTLTRLSDSSVTWASTFQTFTSDLVSPAEFGSGQSFSLDFTLANKVIAPGNSFPEFTTFGLSGTFVAVPEPSTFAMLALGGLGLGMRTLRRRKAIAA